MIHGEQAGVPDGVKDTLQARDAERLGDFDVGKVIGRLGAASNGI